MYGAFVLISVLAVIVLDQGACRILWAAAFSTCGIYVGKGVQKGLQPMVLLMKDQDRSDSSSTISTQALNISKVYYPILLLIERYFASAADKYIHSKDSAL